MFGFTWRKPEEKAFQDFVLAPGNLFGRVPAGWENRLPELVTVPNNFVTAWHTLVVDLGVELPWPKPDKYEQGKHTNTKILIWGGSSSCGQYALQILRYYGYKNVAATASPRNFDLAKQCGAAHVVNYNSKTWKTEVEQAIGKVDLVMDCIGSLEGSVRPISELETAGSAVAILLPVIVRDSSEDLPPIYAMDPSKELDWPAGVTIKGVRTHFYLEVSISLNVKFDYGYFVLVIHEKR